MGKRKAGGHGKRQPDPIDDESTDEEKADDEQQKSCPHVGKAVNISAVKKTLKVAWTRVGVCTLCIRDKRASSQTIKQIGPVGIKKVSSAVAVPSLKKSSSVPKQLSAEDTLPNQVENLPKLPVIESSSGPVIWLCLKCGTQGCAHSSLTTEIPKHHAIAHYKTPRSDLHCIVLCVNNWSLWCFECQSELSIDSYKKLYESVEFVRKISETKSLKPQPSAGDSSLAKGIARTIGAKSTDSNQPVIPKVRGLQNLGNTCFFNAVMQCLSQSHPLTHNLDLQCPKGAVFALPEVTVPPVPDSDLFSDTKPIHLDALSLQLMEAGPITLALAAFFKDMQSIGGKSGVVNPGHLFGQVCRKSPQFRGFQQQDSHELLRHLMEGLRAEEVKRQKCAILKHFGLNEKTDPKTVENKTKRKLQALGKHSNFTIVDRLFGGQLVSTIVCEQCHNSSQIYEPFLDLSLPVMEEKPQRPGGKNKQRSMSDEDNVTVSCFGSKKKIADEADNRKSKSQIKKEKEKARKERRKNKKNKKDSISEVPLEDNKLVEEEDNKKDDEEENQVDAEEEKLKKEMEENEKGSEKPVDEVYHSPDQDEAAANQEDEEEDKVSPSSKLVMNDVAGKAAAFAEKKESSAMKASKDGNEEDDEGGYSEEEEEDWEWDYGEQWEEGDEEKNGEEDDEKSEYLKVENDSEEDTSEKAVVVPERKSLNPLPPERLARGSSDREKSSEPTGSVESDGSSSSMMQADIEDNLEDPSLAKTVQITFQSTQETSKLLKNLEMIEPFRPDPDHLDPHMEQLCRKVRKLSVSSVAPNEENFEQEHHEYNMNGGDSSSRNSVDDRQHQIRLQNDWVARSLTSIAPRYHSRAGECSIYSCLTQFTAPELLTGNNKWACEKCTRMAAENGENEEEEEAKPKVVYSNASKQLLIFCPPAVLTIHLKRFQQTMYNIRKVNRHVEFPLTLDLAPFCSSTALSTPAVEAGVKDIKYYLFGVVEHSGRLGGGHYTAFVKARPAVNADFSKFYSSPLARTEDIHALLEEMERKCREMAERMSPNEVPNGECASAPGAPTKWYHISDSHVSEVSEEKVLKCQAYLLFYERIK